MELNEKLIKPISEVNYLRAENVDRYRLIMRYFFLEYEKIHYWLHREDVYDMMHQINGYQDYTIDQCQQDLEMLVNWKNLTAIQDSNKVRTIEDFKNKKYRYQLSEFGIEIERMTIRLENLEVEGASLEPTLLERIYYSLTQITEIKSQNNGEVNGWLQLLMNDFIRLNQNYQDYIRTLNSAKAEELMKTTEFLIYKDKIIMYLRTFVMTMQDKGNLISLILSNVDTHDLDVIFDKATLYELSIPRLDRELVYDDVYNNFKGKWDSLNRWFVSSNGTSEMDKLYDVTNEIIRKMTRYAGRISEMMNRGSNRKEQYKHIADIFKQCKDVNEAHLLSAYIFGVEDCIHLNYIKNRTSEDINMGVYDEKPSVIHFDPHSRIVRKKYVRAQAPDYSLEKKIHQEEIAKKIDEQRKAMNKLIVDNVIDFSSLPMIDEVIRKRLLLWLSNALEQSDNCYRTDDGDEYYIDKSHENEICILRCNDGDFMMPSYKIVFKEKIDE